VILPYVLEYYGDTVHKSLAELAELVGIVEQEDTIEQKANKFIETIRDLNKAMNIPEKISGIYEKDIPLMAHRAVKEANPLYPVPKILTKEDLLNIFNRIRE